MECVLALQATGRLQLDDLIDVVPVDDAQSAYERLLGDASNRPHGALALAYDGLPDGDTETAEPPRKLEVQSSTISGARRAATAPERRCKSSRENIRWQRPIAPGKSRIQFAIR